MIDTNVVTGRNIEEMEEEEEKIIIHMVKVEAEKMFAGHALNNLTIESREALMSNDLIFTLRTMIPAEHMKSATEVLKVMYPETWWQMFKEEHFKGWLLKHFPIRYKTIKKVVHFDACNLYPKLPQVFECGKSKQVIITRYR